MYMRKTKNLKKIKKIKGGRTLKKKNCSPYGEDNKINNKSCLNKDIILKLKKSYNKNNKENKIKSRSLRKIWESLKERKPSCQDEICWLNDIDNKRTKESIKTLLYAPDQPSEWKKNPDEWLSNYDILDVLEQYEYKYKNFKFIGPTPINFNSPDIEDKKGCVWNELCKFNLKYYIKNKINKIGVIFNLAKQGEAGTHWVSLFIDIKNKFILYFDSNGEACPPEIYNLIMNIEKQGKKEGIEFKIIYNTYEHQKTNTECGMYSLYFIITILTEKIDGKKVLITEKLINHFTKQRVPDNLVFNRRKIYYNE